MIDGWFFKKSLHVENMDVSSDQNEIIFQAARKALTGLSHLSNPFGVFPFTRCTTFSNVSDWFIAILTMAYYNPYITG